MSHPNWAMRTICQGRVKVLHHWYRPDEQFRAYDGRFDGKRWLFALYWNGEIQQPYLYLWGSERYAEAQDPDAPGYEDDVVDGYLPWAWWRLCPDPSIESEAAYAVLENDAYWHPFWRLPDWRNLLHELGFAWPGTN